MSATQLFSVCLFVGLSAIISCIFQQKRDIQGKLNNYSRYRADCSMKEFGPIEKPCSCKIRVAESRTPRDLAVLIQDSGLKKGIGTLTLQTFTLIVPSSLFSLRICRFSIVVWLIFLASMLTSLRSM